MKLIVHPVELPLRHPFTTSHGTRTVQHNVIVELRDGPHRGFGEAPGIPYYGVGADVLTSALEAARGLIESERFVHPASLWERVRGAIADQPFALCAVDEAAHDLWGKREGRRVHEIWQLDAAAAPPSSYTIGIDTIDNMVGKMREFDGWPIYKIKLGTRDDLAIVKELRRHTDAVFRVDANTGWGVDETLSNAAALRDLGVEFIEQPLPRDDRDGMRRIYERSALPIIADESCVEEADVDRCADHFHGVNVKLSKAGGLTPGRRMIERARQLDMKTMVGCMTESTVGISAVAQLLPMVDYADIDGALLLADDVATGVQLDRGRARFPDCPGLGIEPTAALAQRAKESPSPTPAPRSRPD